MYELCIDARMLLASGIGTYLRTLLPLIAKGPFRIRLIVSKDLVEQLPWLSRFALEIVEAPIYSVAEQLQLPSKAGRCDLFWSPHYNIPLLPLRARRRLTTIHDVNHLAFYENLDLTQKLYASLVMRQAIKRSDRVITVSEFSKRELCSRAKAPADKISVIHHGVDKKHFASEYDGREELVVKRYQLPQKYFLFVGNLKPHKNLAGLIRAYHYASGELADFPLIVVGKREGFIHMDRESQQIIEQFALHRKIIFLNFVSHEDLPALYRLATATIFPSLYEGFGLPAVEAMSAGSPLAVSRAASLPEVCSDAAVYFDPHDPKDIARVLIQLASHPQLLETLMQKGKHRSEQFCWEKCAAAHIRLMEEICEQP